MNDFRELEGCADNDWKEAYQISAFLRLLKEKLAAERDGTEESVKRKKEFDEELLKQRNAVDNKD